MRSDVVSKETLVVAVVLAGVLAVDYLLPIGQLPSLLLAVAVVLAGVLAVVPGAWRTLYRKTGIRPGAWLLAAAVAGGGVALVYWTGDPQPFCEGIRPYRGCLTAFGWAATIFVGSSLGVAVSVGHLGRYRRVREASTGPVADVGEGMVAVEGRIDPVGRPLVGPVSGQETVWYRAATEEPTLFGGHREVDAETAGDEFYVEDGSGRLLVLADRIDEHAAAEFARSHTSDGDGSRRREWSLTPDDAVTVVGRAGEVSRAEYPEPVVVGLDGPVIVATRTLGDLRTWATRRAVVGAALAVVVGGTSFVVMLVTA